MPTYLIIPNATDQISQSQSQIQTNFASIKSLIEINHGKFADGVNFGKHNEVEFPVQATAPTFLSGEVGLYNLLPISPFPLTTVNELFINKNTTGGAVTIPMTASILSTNPAPGNNSSGWTYLPSGIIMKWGHNNAVGNAPTTTTFPVVGSTIPAFTQIFTIMITTNNYPANNNQLVTLGSFNVLTFDVFNRQLIGGATTVPFQYLAIGY